MFIQADINVITIFQNMSPVAKAVVAVLAIFSVGSWGIILSKSLLLRKVARESQRFWKIFRKGQSLSEISTACETLQFTPLVPVFNAGAELLQSRNTVGAVSDRARGSTVTAVKAAVSVPRLQREMQRAATAQLTAIESRLTFLATTASVTPFIGLFGTVWGVLVSFNGLANATAVATLKAVAPGIADSLVTTAFGLLAAIPAVIFYNQFVYQIRNIGGQLDDLQTEMLGIAEGNDL
jgi:biopolymer transport protein TolQ